jgi:hypothetical protein
VVCSQEFKKEYFGRRVKFYPRFRVDFKKMDFEKLYKTPFLSWEETKIRG